MKKAQMGLLALCAIFGVTSAFTTKAPAKQNGDPISRQYGITGVTTVNGTKYYNVVLFGSGSCNSEAFKTCSGTYTSDLTVSSVPTAAFHVTVTDAQYSL